MSDIDSLIRGIEKLNINQRRRSGSPKQKRRSGSPKHKSEPVLPKRNIAISGILMTSEISRKTIMFIAKIIITSLNESSIHLSKNFTYYIILLTSLSFAYITYIIRNTRTYSVNDLDVIINEFVDSIRVLFEIPRKNLRRNSQDIQRCFESAASESAMSIIGLGSGPKKMLSNYVVSKQN